MPDNWERPNTSSLASNTCLPCSEPLALSALVGVTLNAILPGKLGMKIKSMHGKEKQNH